MEKIKPLTPEDLVGILRRRWVWIACMALLGPALGYGVARVLPARYTSETLMLVEQQQVPADFVKPVITEELNARVTNIQAQTLSRSKLQPIIEKYGLFKRETSKASMDDLVLRLQKAVELEPITPILSSSERTVPGFHISVTLGDPRQAQQVCADIASMFVDEDIRQRERSAQGTTSFLQSQLDDAKRKLDEQDARLAAFKRKYMGMLPDETDTNLNILSTLNTQLQADTQALTEAQQNKAYAESILAQQLQAWKMTRAMGINNTPLDTQSPVDQHLSALKQRLAALQTTYTNQYPEIIELKKEIAELEKQANPTEAPAAKDGPKKAGGQESAAEALEPPQIQQLRAQTRAYDQAIKADQAEQQRLKDMIKSYESRLQLSPAVEEEYKLITRDHDTALHFYNDLLNKRNESGMAGDLERRQEGERFRVVDAASFPDKPSFPKRPLFALGGLAGGIACGAGIALLLELLHPVVRTERDIEFYLGVAPFALVPQFDPPSERALNTSASRMNAVALR